LSWAEEEKEIMYGGGKRRTGKEENINDMHTVPGKSTLPSKDPHPVNYPSLSPGSQSVFQSSKSSAQQNT